MLVGFEVLERRDRELDVVHVEEVGADLRDRDQVRVELEGDDARRVGRDREREESGVATDLEHGPALHQLLQAERVDHAPAVSRRPVTPSSSDDW